MARKTVGEHSANKSTDEVTPTTASEREYSDSVVPPEGPPEVQRQEPAAEVEGEEAIQG